MTAETTNLGPLEQRAMEQLWQRGSATVGEVLDALNTSGPEALAYTTVMTVLVRLFEKGYLTRTREGRRFRYAAAVDEASLPALAARAELQRLIDRHGAAAMAAFAADLSGADSELTTRLWELAGQPPEVHE